MTALRNYNGRILSLGRAGELAIETDAQTFHLISRIFGKEGPYRKVLSEFGIGNPNDEKDFLLYLDGKVYSDIEIENDVLWKHVLAKLVEKNENVELISNIKFPAMLVYGSRYIKKTMKETKILSDTESFVKEAEEIYKKFSELLVKTIENGSISEEEFLKAYKDVVYVTYIYELVFSYNQETQPFAPDKCLSEYIEKNDYLFKYDKSYVELMYGSDFSLKDRDKVVYELRRVALKNLKFIPDEIEDILCPAPLHVSYEKKLQCIKNNLRLKTNLLIKFIP